MVSRRVGHPGWQAWFIFQKPDLKPKRGGGCEGWAGLRAEAPRSGLWSAAVSTDTWQTSGENLVSVCWFPRVRAAKLGCCGQILTFCYLV